MPRALIADDDADLLAVLVQVIEGLGYEVTCVTDGQELLEKLADDHDYDLVITDFSMPWMTGAQAVQFARTAGQHTKVVVITGTVDPRVPTQVRALGDDVEFLKKPFTRDELCEVLAR